MLFLQTQEVQKAMDEKKFEEAVRLRGRYSVTFRMRLLRVCTKYKHSPESPLELLLHYMVIFWTLAGLTQQLINILQPLCKFEKRPSLVAVNTKKVIALNSSGTRTDNLCSAKGQQAIYCACDKKRY